MTSEPLRIGVLGAARISKNAIVGPAHAAGARLVAVAARDSSRAAAFAAEHGIERVVGSYAELVADVEVEAIYNPLPNGLHAPWNLAAIAAGKHVLSEKPFASDALQAAQVRDAAIGTGLVVADGFHYRYHPVALRVLGIVTSGQIGEVRRVVTSMTTPPPPDWDPRWDWSMAGGALMDLGCYSIHAQRLIGTLLGGEPTVVNARAGERAGHQGVDEWLTADLTFPSGASGTASCNMAGDAEDFSWTITGTLGKIHVPQFVVPSRDDRVIVRSASGERTEHLGLQPSYDFQLQAFTAAVREGAPMPTDVDDAVATMTMIDRCYGLAGLPLRERVQR